MFDYAQAVASVCKKRYDKGQVPKSLHTMFPVLAATPRDEGDGGAEAEHVVQHSTPQAASSSFQQAMANFEGSDYTRFSVDFKFHYSLCRVSGPAMEAARAKGELAFLDLVSSEFDGAALTEMKSTEIYLTRNGSGMLGQFAAGTVFTGNTISLRLGDDIINFDRKMRINVFDQESVTATQRAIIGTPPRVVGINKNPDVATLTLENPWNTYFAGLTDNDWICRAGDGPSGGVAQVIIGDDEWIKGGSTPGTAFGVNRNTDPVALAGQTLDGSTKGYEEAIIDAEALLGYQGSMTERILKVSSRDAAALKKVAAARMTLERMQGSVAGLSWQTVKFAGDYGPITMLISPFVRRGRAVLGTRNAQRLDSMGPTPRMLHWNEDRMLIVANDDAVEGRWGAYQRFRTRSPLDFVRILNYGGT